MSPYAILAIPASFVGLAVVLAVIRADPKDLPAIIRALRGMGPGDDKRDDDSGNGPPSLPRP